MDEALTSILLVSDGAVAALKQRTTGSKPGTIAPTSDLASIVHGFDMRFEACRTHRQRLMLIKEAQVLSVRLRYSPDRSFVPGTKEWREKVAHDERDNAIIMHDYELTERHLQRIRKEFGTNRQRGGARQTTRLAKCDQAA